MGNTSAQLSPRRPVPSSSHSPSRWTSPSLPSGVLTQPLLHLVNHMMKNMHKLLLSVNQDQLLSQMSSLDTKNLFLWTLPTWHLLDKEGQDPSLNSYPGKHLPGLIKEEEDQQGSRQASDPTA